MQLPQAALNTLCSPFSIGLWALSYHMPSSASQVSWLCWRVWHLSLPHHLPGSRETFFLSLSSLGTRVALQKLFRFVSYLTFFISAYVKRRKFGVLKKNNIYFVYNRCSWSSWGTKRDWGGWRLVYYDLGPSSKWWWITHLRYILSFFFFFLWWCSNIDKRNKHPKTDTIGSEFSSGPGELDYPVARMSCPIFDFIRYLFF